MEAAIFIRKPEEVNAQPRLARAVAGVLVGWADVGKGVGHAEGTRQFAGAPAAGDGGGSGVDPEQNTDLVRAAQTA